jgi:hypothetical protein
LHLPAFLGVTWYPRVRRASRVGMH